MFQKLLSIFKITDLRNKILFVLGVFVVFRVMANIPIPGIDASRLHEFFEGNQLFGLLNLFTGGALDNLSLVMLGLGPYITAVIVLQLLTMIFPAFERMYKEEGEAGRQKFNQYGRMLAVPFALVQGYAFLTLLSRQGIIDRLAPLEYVTALGTVIAGTLFLMWLGELITEKGIGNGVSLLIFAGIVAEFPLNARQMFVDWDPTRTLPIASFFLMAFLIVAGVVFVTEARRNIPVSYAKRVRGNKMYGGSSTYLPLSVNPAGVIPIIFALSLLLFPGMIANFFLGADGIIGSVARFVVTYFDPSGWGYIVAYFLLVGVFTFFYTAVTFDPKSISTNLQKMGGFVPGVRPGSSTAEHISYILNRILLIGALFLGTVAVMPFLVQFVTEVTAFQFLLGGTALLIMVTVALETMRQIRAQLQMRDYDTF
ncbi:MAG: preprotein translocase subunit SecY [Candidatus Wildermuthbacteria bacterium RIFCSPLOWO2_02_FULL_47_9c]|uniref:Protein translocase subunit SecY n=2 Tax=Parcubacteria group TaxID=1794811 RepID=A0A837ILL7_9BACT|nr:MAG: preprotein translocase, SecY subunit, preprotein translocase subunit SecY [Candidatus Yanofskybacteria bacterium GW2011_GWC1_48_11]KKW04575.1 MAG: Protein translocase subunit SecY [Parcubacteria group bacterium GW2011_GWB1_49_12]KKW09167.1 MAG: Protein translocase subunit SecY [Parcubacteria group bacterium GW2011_GWA1_49_26]OHA61420.1 MAG: preprotein translocase subunit SecY [Candidatus Wildermuthbacteria bacterium GWA1_49_26]OHA66237.1 MAG: preprotein translocase subunit SecY [Candida